MLDRDKAREVLRTITITDFGELMYEDDVLDALSECVVPATIDRDALHAIVAEAKLAQIEALPIYRKELDALGWVSADKVFAILRSDN